MVFQGMNLAAILVAAVAAFMLGGLWYSPILFANPWMVCHGYDPTNKAQMEELRKKSPAPMYISAFIASLIAAVILSRLFSALLVHDVMRGVKIAFFVWLGFVATVQLTGTIAASKTMKLYFIDTGYQLVSYIIMGAILAAWR